jgi:hypothetical protein
MKRIIWNIIFLYIPGLTLLILTASCSGNREKSISLQSQSDGEFYTKDPFFNAAFIEIKAMLEDKQPLNFKRAVFLSEYSYAGNELSYEQFNEDVEATVTELKKFIESKNINQYKTAGNYAIFEYMMHASSMNGNIPFKYDFDDFYGEKDWRSTFVTKLMRTKKGNCRSLPYYYKILANEMGAEAKLAYAPNHIYIKHVAEDGQWINVELTNGSFSSDAWLIQSFEISQKAISNRIYMEAITEKQSIAACLFDLMMGYTVKYGEDDFALLCCNTILKYHPNNIQALLSKHNILITKGKLLKEECKNKEPTAELKENYREFVKTKDLIDSLGYHEMSQGNYEDWMQLMEAEKKRQATKN